MPVIAGIFAVMFACIRLRVNRPFLTLVSAGFGFATVLFTVQSLMPLASTSGNILLTHLAMTAMVICFWSATFVRAGRPVPVALYVSIGLAYFAGALWFLYVTPDFDARAHLSNIALALIIALALRSQLRDGPAPANAIIAGLAIVSIAYYAWRSFGLVLMLETPEPVTLPVHDVYSILVKAFALLIAILTAIAYVVVLAYDLYDELRQESSRDHLSGLLNRRGFETAANGWLAANPDTTVSLIVADLDHFKRLNDSYGHAAGDAAIACFSQLLSRHAGQDCILGRIGGEEFAVLLPQRTAPEVRLYVDSIRRSLSQQTVPDLPEDIRFTASFGACSSAQSRTLTEMLRVADRGLYAAKRAGRNRMSMGLGAVDAPPVEPTSEDLMPAEKSLP
ncbi:MAG: GGDEF domain-containing protein [Rhizobiaceae bacterium]|nr:GGDEF domain-containing protein [Rhizobiaceae bacterium]